MVRRLSAFLPAAVLACAGGAEVTAPPAYAKTMVLSLAGLPPLDALREGSYEAWMVDRQGVFHSAGRFAPSVSVALTLPEAVADPVSVIITVEPPFDSDAQPSKQHLLKGAFSGANATLRVVGALTQGDLALRERPGQFTIFTPSDNAINGYPSHEEAGIWLFNMAPFDTPQGDMWVRLTQLQAGWIYEGWVVRDVGLPGAVWFSYGKFLPDQTGAVSARDDQGWGAFSGVLDFASEQSEEFPGGDFISNPLHLPVPGDLLLPLNLTEKTAAGGSRWTHVITIEPAWNKGEGLATERPFFLAPYSDAVGSGGPGLPRTITYRASVIPSGSAVLR